MELSQGSSKPLNIAMIGPKIGQVCTRQELRPKLVKQVTFTINCQEMAESALKNFNLTIADLVSKI